MNLAGHVFSIQSEITGKVTYKCFNLTHAIVYISDKVNVEREDYPIAVELVKCENLEEIDLPLAPVPSSRPKMKGEQNIAYSINLKKVSKNNKYWWYNRRHESS
uniref:39S ribosomal protein L9, mitochondrial n=1 Tax=Strongyloides venezuelensis TaxID=75913 RepID=A0A0K0EVR4_STRVS